MCMTNQTESDLKNRTYNNNDIIYTAKLYRLKTPSFPSSGSFIDLGILDTRIIINNSNGNKVNTIPFDSDHVGLVFYFSFHDFADDNFEHNKIKKRYDFNKTKWEDFNNHIDNNAINILINKNITNQEIENYLNYINDTINTALRYPHLK